VQFSVVGRFTCDFSFSPTAMSSNDALSKATSGNEGKTKKRTQQPNGADVPRTYRSGQDRMRAHEAAHQYFDALLSTVGVHYPFQPATHMHANVQYTPVVVG